MEWTELTRKGKPLPIILIDSVGYAFQDYFTEFHDKKTKITKYRQAFGGRGVPTNQWEKFIQMYKENENKIVPWMNFWLNEFNKLKEFSERISKVNLHEKSNKELKKLFEKYFELTTRVVAFAYDYRALQEYYPEEIIAFLKEKSSAKELNNYLKTILALPEPTEMHKEKRDLLGLAIKTKKGINKEQLQKELENHAEKYGFFGTYIYVGDPLTPKDYEKKLNKLLKKPFSKLEKELKKEKNKFKENQKEVQKIIKKLNLPPKAIKKTENIRCALYVSMVGDEYYSYVALKASPLLIEISKRFSLSFNQIIEMQNQEILSLFKKPLSKEHLNEINARAEDHALIFEKGKIKVLVGKELEEYSKPYLKELKKIEKMIEIQGETAFPGKAKGKVKLIRNVHDLPNFKKRNILVTGTTLPQYVPAMKKASAIVTDEGGMLSHAAIMSREFKTPCVIGTKIATRVLKDNELVEVDAGKGIIRKVKA